MVEGRIFKRAEIMGKWQQRYVKIDGGGLKSYKNPNYTHSLHIRNTQQLWSRFELINGGQYMVVKLKFNGIKYEFGIPKQNLIQWLLGFYSLLH